MFNQFGRLVASLGLVTLLGLTAPAEATGVVPQTRDDMQYSFAPLVKRVAPAVVNIYSRKVVRTQSNITRLFDDPIFQRFFGEGFAQGPGTTQERVQQSLGSGVIVRSDGLIVTNHHVIEGADQITVILADRREFEAKIVGVDDRSDLAVLRIDTHGEPLPILEFHDSDNLEVGDLVLAIGNPFGVGQTVTSGIVSGLARTGVGISDLNFFIQTDAAINPGNSGGALVSMDGRLVGINTAIFSKSGASAGVGFATPSNMVRWVLMGITENGKLKRPWLGASGQSVSAEIAETLGQHSPAGVLLNDVQAGGPAETAGLKEGDVVLSINGRAVDDPGAMKYRLAMLPIGEDATLDVLRRGRPLQVHVKLMVPPEVPPRDATLLAGQQPLQGAVVANMSPALADELGGVPFKPGVIILDFQRGSLAASYGFQRGDMIRNINGETVKDVHHLIRLLQQGVESWKIVYSRGPNTGSLEVSR